MAKIFTWISGLFSNTKNNTLIGLSQLREAKEPMQEFAAVKKNKTLKISDIIKG